ncbi:heme/hemopexin-binding protein precursor [mine drainage metagenome]|uniref:Heme/hemopexin-binding protein n=1 Tax=mine drainage metagenome TaxID=410659 RepID=A0A1J5T2H9_9ZZZZ
MKKSSITKSLTRKLVLASLAAGPVALVPTLRALPSTASTNLTAPSTVTWASGQLSNELDITSTAANTVLQWKNFGSGTDTIAAGDIIKFNLPSSSSGVLNMVTGGTATTIAGAITSNGRVYVMNTAGVMVSSGAQINAASFVASTTNDTDATQSFLATGDLSYSGTAQADVSEAGKITGNVYLAGKNVSVSGDANNTISGELKINAAGTVSLSGANVTGNLNIKNATGVELAAAGTTTIAGNISLVSTGAVTTTGTLANTSSGKYTATVDAGSNAVTINGNLDALTITNGGAVTTSGKLSTLTLTNAASASVTDSVALAVSGKTTGGNLSITETGGDVTLGNTSVAGGLTVSDTAATSNVAMASGAAVSATGTVSLSATKSVSFTGSGAITLDATTLAPTATITGSGNITSNSALAAGVTTLSVTSTGGNIDFSGTAIGSTATSLTLNANGTLKTGNINDSSTGTTKLTGSSVTTGTIDTKDLWVTTNNGTASLGTVGGAGALNSATLSITGADVALPTLSATTLTVTGSGQVTSANVLTSTSASITAGDAITLSGANAIGSLKLVDSTTKAVSVTNNGALVLANGTNVAGATTVDTSAANGNITFGAGASDTLTFAGLTLKAGSGAVTEANKTLSLTTGNLSVAAGSVDVESTNNMFGTLTGTVSGATTIVQSSAMNVGALTVTGANALSLTSNTSITSSGVITAGGTSAFDLTSAGDVTLNTANMFTGAVSVGAGGKVGNVAIQSGGTLNLDKVIATKSVTLNSTGAITQTVTGITAPTLSITGVATTLNSTANKLGSVTLATNGAVTVDNSTGDLTVGGSTKGGNLTVANQGAGNLIYNAAVTDNSTVSLTAGVASSKAGDITVNGSTTGNGLLTATANDGMIHLGSYYSAAGGISLNTAGTSGMGVDDVSGSRANVYGDIWITTNGGTINLVNNAPAGIKTSTTVASRFGGYHFDTTNGVVGATGADINVIEGGTVRIVSVNAGKSNISLTATNADGEFSSNPSNIVSTDTGLNATTLTGNNITLNARNSVILDNQGQTVTAAGYLYALANTDSSLATSVVTLGNAATWGGAASTSTVNVTGVVDAIASGNVLIASGDKQNVKLGGGNALTGDFYAGGTLSVYAGGTITQDTNRLRAKSTVTLDATTNSTTNGANNIDLSTGTDNEFGGMKLGGKSITITENGSTRLLAVHSTGDLTVTSAGDIIDAMTAGPSDATQAISVTGTATFAPSGMLSLTNTNNSIANLKVTAAGASQNVTLVDSTAVTLVNGTNIGGNFTLTDSANNAVPAITEAAASAITVGGTVTFNATQGNSSISVLGTNNQFGKLAFQSNGAVSITQGTDMVLVAGNTGGGTAKSDTVLQSVNGGVSTDSVAGSTASFTGNVRLYSHGNVAIDAPWNVGSTLYITTPSSATLDLSGLSLAGNLNGTKPMWNGTAIASGTDGLMQ